MRSQYFAPMVRVLAPVCLGSLMLAGCKSGADKDNTAQAPPAAAIATVQQGKISHVLSLAGQFQPYQVVEVHAKVSGYIRHIYVDIGDRVHAGETLATLEVPELNAQYKASQSEALRSNDAIASAEQEVTRAKSLHAALQADYERLKKASDEQPGVIAAQELEDAQSQADASQAKVDAALAALSGAKQGALTTQADQQRVGALQSYTNVTAPLTGVITWRYADTGNLIEAGTNSDVQSRAIVVLSQSDLLRLRVPVPEDAVQYIHVGDSMQITVDALNKKFDGKVVRFTRNLDPTTRTMETEVDVPNPTLAITPGMYANTYLQLAHVDNVLTMPIAAVEGQGENAKVMVLNSDNELQERSVQLGLKGSLLVEVKSGLQAGDRVLLGGGARYREGEKITPRVQQEPSSDVMHEEGGMTNAAEDDSGSGE